MGIIHRIIRRCVSKYLAEEKKENNILKECSMGEESVIQSPYVISHPELLKIGSNTTILPYARIQVYPELTGSTEYKLSIGKNSFFGYRLSILVGANITIGDNVVVASDVSIVSENHGINPEIGIPYMDQKLQIAPISIGNNCWIGDKVIITAGVTIGDNCVIGAGSIVTKNVPSMSIAVGNPARVIKRYDMQKHDWMRIENSEH